MFRPEATLQDLIQRERRLTGHQTRTAYEPCQHCGTLVSGSHSCPVLEAQDLESKSETGASVRRFGLLRKFA